MVNVHRTQSTDNIDQGAARGQFAAALQQRGLCLRAGGAIQADGQIHRCNVAGKTGYHGVGDGSYVLHVHANFAAGGFQNWTDGYGWEKWTYKRPGWTPSVEEQRDIDAEIERARNDGEQELAKARGEACSKANRMWKSADKATAAHPYCQNKQVNPRGLKQWRFADGAWVLLVPMWDADSKLVNLQFVRSDGHKHGLTGGQQGDCHFWIDKPRRGQPICICEGWATGQSIYEATKFGVVVAFNAENLLAVAEWVRQQYPDDKIIVCADDDHTTAGNPGIIKASEAARAVNGLVAVPVFGENRKADDTDMNDLACASGIDAVALAIRAAFPPPDPDNLDEADAADGESETAETKKQSDALVQMAASADLFHDADHAAYADIRVKDHRETYPVKSRNFKLWLTGTYYRATKSAPSPNALTMALAVVEAQAVHDGSQHDVHLRVAGHDGCIYLDLCDADWHVVEVDTDGWRVTKTAPVRFIRRKGMLALPVPTQGGTLKRLRRYINVNTDADFTLACAWPIGALCDHGPYPVLSANGEAGTAKSTLIKVLRALVDPNKAPLRAPPREDRDLFIAASNAHAVSFDNLSELRSWLSDSLARLSTGGGFATRQLFTDDDERLFEATRPVLLGAIANVVVKGDLADRCIRLELKRIPDSKRQREREFWESFERDRPAILGALLDAVAHGLRELPNLDLTKLPRMADFTAWVVACGDGLLWEPGAFVKAYAANRSNMTRDVVDADAVASAVQELMTGVEAPWSGTMTDLLARLDIVVGDKVAQRKGWPTTAAALGGRLRQVAPQLRRLGIHMTSTRQGKERVRTVTLTRNVKVGKSPSAPSASTDDPTRNPLKNATFFGGGQADRADGDLQTSPPRGHRPVRRPLRANGTRPPRHDN